MPTISRPQDYLTRTLDSIAKQLGGQAQRTDVIVFHPRPGQNHPVFKSNQARLGAGKYKEHFHFVEQRTITDPFSGNQEPTDPNSSDVPGHVARQQTCDVVSMMRRAVKEFPTCRWYMFMEDDFVMCDSALKALRHAAAKADAYNPGWSGLRISFGLNGVVVPCKDVPKMADFMLSKSSWRPADLLSVYWLASIANEGRLYMQGRKMSVYRYNMMNHIGRVSTYPGRTTGQQVNMFLKCYDMLNPWSLHAQVTPACW